jgi:AraC family transcriptional regulator
MTTPVLIADRGAAVDLPSHPQTGVPVWLAAVRGSRLRTVGAGFTIWIQLRGIGQLTAREGVFTLAAGEWLALDRSGDGGFARQREGHLTTTMQVARHGLAIGLTFPAEAFAGRRRGDLLPGRGRVSRRDLRVALRLWRDGIAEARAAIAAGVPAAHSAQAMLAHVSALQHELDVGISRCPGRSIWRKRQVFGRLQRARLYLEGHRDRVVRLTELAELTSFSSWYLSKTFHVIYQESPQAASVRLRLEHACELLAATASAAVLPLAAHADTGHDPLPADLPSIGSHPLGPASIGSALMGSALMGSASIGPASISEIGAACGFENSCSFARAFRARFGMTASDYRERLRRQASASRGKVSA